MTDNNGHEKKEETIDEIREILDCLGISHTDGYVMGKHASVMLDYLRQNKDKKENYDITASKLATKLWMQDRYIKERLKGFENWGIITTYQDEFNNKKWVWNGMKAFRGEKIDVQK